MTVKDNNVEIALPENTFVHANPNAEIKYEAKMADGQPLPAWLDFNPEMGTIAVKDVKAGSATPLKVTIVARDADGAMAETVVEIDLKRLRGG